MKKYKVGYCWNCCKDTKHQVIECETNLAERIFLGIITLGFSEIAGHSYHGECCECGEINTLD